MNYIHLLCIIIDTKRVFVLGETKQGAFVMLKRTRSTSHAKQDYMAPDMPMIIQRTTLSASAPRTLTTDYRWHDDIEFIYVYSGTLSINVDGAVYSASEGQGIILNSRHLHSMYSVTGDDCEYLNITFSPVVLSAAPYIERTFVKPLLENEGFTAMVLKLGQDWSDRIINGIRRIGDSYEQNGYDSLMESLSIVYDIWSMLYSRIPRSGESRSNGKHELAIMRLMIDHIRDHYNTKMTLESLCRAGGVSVSYGSKLFKKYLDSSPVDFVIDYRLNKSTHLLKHTGASVKEVAAKVGFANSCYYAKRFRERFGMTPSEFRARYS